MDMFSTQHAGCDACRTAGDWGRLSQLYEANRNNYSPDIQWDMGGFFEAMIAFIRAAEQALSGNGRFERPAVLSGWLGLMQLMHANRARPALQTARARREEDALLQRSKDLRAFGEVALRRNLFVDDRPYRDMLQHLQQMLQAEIRSKQAEQPRQQGNMRWQPADKAWMEDALVKQCQNSLGESAVLMSCRFDQGFFCIFSASP